ncbi:MAG: aldehyde dehydrogenase family protein [Akkermansiaceae bacterium]|jgi:aldehyde dehydrogenase (NAD+)|nr:aldehyde dehydrogenase family protein [Akkermansiaceae bacterium]
MSDDCNRGIAESAWKTARTGFEAGAGRLPDDRVAALRRLSDALRKRENELLEALRADLGKPGVEAWLAEYRFVLDDLSLLVRNIKRWAAPQRVSTPFPVQPGRSGFRHEPLGAVLIISPWNYPIQLALSPLAAAIAAGNSVVLKPSELAPASAAFLASLIADVFPPDHAQVVTGGAETASALLDQPFDFFFFTGGEKIGRLVASAAARHLKPCALELGGKCPVVIGTDVPLEMAADRIVDAKWFNAGQTCVAPDFVLVPAAQLDAWTAALQSAFEARLAAAGPDDFTRMIHRRHFDRLLAMADGCPGLGPDAPERLHFAPRVFPATWDHPAMREEIFGPLLPVVAYDSDLLPHLRALPSPLALYVFSRSEDFIDSITSVLPSGGIGINDCAKHVINLRLPFGGIGPSGHGRYRGKYGFETFSHARAWTRRPFFRDLFSLRPPYSGKLDFFRRWLK